MQNLIPSGVQFVPPVEMIALNGKKRKIQAADVAGTLRIIQSIPSPKAEPFKMWLAEATTTELSKAHNPQTFEENRDIAKRGGKYAGNARKEIEADTGKSVITSKNATEKSGCG